MRELYNLVIEALNERQRFAQQTGHKYNAANLRFKPLYDQQSAQDNLFIQYSDINKLGLNPGSKYQTPLAIYAYPTYMFRYEELVNGNVPFAGERKHILGFKANNHNKLLVIDSQGAISNNSGIKEEQIPSLFQQAGIEMAYFNSRDTATGKNLVYGIYTKAEHNAQIASSLYRKMGIEGVVDEGSGAIHQNEPVQAMFFSKQYLKPLFVIDNMRLGKDKKKESDNSTFVYSTELNRLAQAGQEIGLGEQYKQDYMAFYQSALNSLSQMKIRDKKTINVESILDINDGTFNLQNVKSFVNILLKNSKDKYDLSSAKKLNKLLAIAIAHEKEETGE